jgi:hypothetical protein
MRTYQGKRHGKAMMLGRKRRRKLGVLNGDPRHQPHAISGKGNDGRDIDRHS